MQSRVHVVSCIDESGIMDATIRALDRLGESIDPGGKGVFLKVNLMKGAQPQRALNTHPEVIRGAIRWVRSRGGEPVFGDSSGIPGYTMQCAKQAGYLELAEEEGVPFIDLDRGPFEAFEAPWRDGRTLWISREVLESQVRITLPKLKSHLLTGFTGALKNQVGLLPGATKARLHADCPSRTRLAAAVLDLNVLVPFHGALLDATWVLEGGGSMSGRPRWAGYMAACEGLSVMDLGACLLMGWEAERQPITREAIRRGSPLIGEGDVLLEGGGSPKGAIPMEPPPRHWSTNPLLSRLMYALRERALRPHHNEQRCRGCMRCQQVCPAKAVAGRAGQWIRHDLCVRCFACSSGCPEGALVVKPRGSLGPFVRKRMQGVDS